MASSLPMFREVAEFCDEAEKASLTDDGVVNDAPYYVSKIITRK
jgi:hypothetical protein